VVGPSAIPYELCAARLPCRQSYIKQQIGQVALT